MLSIIDGFHVVSAGEPEGKSRFSPFSLVLALAVLLSCFVATVACSGTSSPSATDGPPASGGTAQAKPPAADVRKDPYGLLNPTPTKIDPPPAGSTELLLGGHRPVRASREAYDALKAAGMDMTGVGVSIINVIGQDQSILVIEIDGDAIAAAASGASVAPPDNDALIGSLLDAPFMKSQKVTQIVLVLRASDESGPLTATIAMPVSVLQAVNAGTMTDEEAQKRLQMKIERGEP